MIKLRVRHQKLELIDKQYLANKSHNYLELHFDFTTEDWNDRQKYCLIQVNNKTYQFIIDEEILLLPGNVLHNRVFKISVYGITVEEYTRITTNQIRITSKESNYTEDVSPVNPVKGDIFTLVFEELESRVKWEDVDQVLDITSENPVSNSLVASALQGKSDINHTHNPEDVPGIDTVAEFEIKKAYNLLSNKIRTYGE